MPRVRTHPFPSPEPISPQAQLDPLDHLPLVRTAMHQEFTDLLVAKLEEASFVAQRAALGRRGFVRAAE